MKNLIVFLFTFSLIIISCSDENEWENAQKDGSIEAYTSFVEKFPDDVNADKALKMIDSIDQDLWLNAKKDSTIVAFEKYISSDHKGKFIEEAKIQISIIQDHINETEDWDNAVLANTTEKYKEFVKKYPESKHIKNAEIAVIKLDLPTHKRELFDFFVYISENDYEGMLQFFSDTVNFYVSGDDYENEDIIAAKLDKKTLDKYGYWNIGGDLFYMTFVYETYGAYDENTCEIIQAEDNIRVEFNYTDNGFHGFYTLIWKTKNGKWKITDSQITLPSFM